MLAPRDRVGGRGWSPGMVAALAAMCLLLASSTSRADGEQPPAPVMNAESAALPANAAAPPVSPNPGLDLRSPTPQPEQPSIFGRWWFWTAVGAAVAATVVIVVVSSRGASPPATDLGNQEFQP